MMGNPVAVSDRRFCGPDIEPFIQLEGIAVDQFSTEGLRQVNREARFPSGRWANNYQDKTIAQGHPLCHRNAYTLIGRLDGQIGAGKPCKFFGRQD